MHDKGAPFVVYRRGPGSFIIVPRGVAGWAQFAAWLALLGLLVVWFADHVGLTASGEERAQAMGLFIFGLMVWIISGVWWMLARAQVVEMAELQRDRQLQRRKRRRGGD